MAEDYYKVLGIQRDAGDAEIQKAYRDMARKYHPDLNPNDAKAKEKFQSVQKAYEVLSDPKQREMYDRFGAGFENMGGAGAGGGPTAGFDPEEFDFSEIFGGGAAGQGGFADLFKQFSQGGRATKPRATRQTKGKNLNHVVTVPFQVAVQGGELNVNIPRPDGRVDSLSVKIPAGIEDGKSIRLKGQGAASPTGGPAGDVLLKINIGTHPFFQRRGIDLIVQIPISLSEAISGATVDVPTARGTISLKVPPNSSSGKKLRIKGHGVAEKDGTVGDLYAELQIVLPVDQAELEKLKQAQVGPADPRSDLQW